MIRLHEEIQMLYRSARELKQENATIFGMISGIVGRIESLEKKIKNSKSKEGTTEQKLEAIQTILKGE